ncbi:hypothetical protein M427DRAFT_27660 [Gonapodya prolifera JEL478]|uniref:Uncharacterized protein n=1 Tax=Gonapodya prolifera (strain JEL478) TaxID=1344416 RepID=A0A139AWW9_GONPJ|nr:hypothetical protein M427DRAFT_27660 [Gonapodya prolifera JEL478]|eukprot:KXS21236.1 hypothetical protein M427DRAFT_27660 [Gonapodya prolifera JEL478]
MSEAVEPVDAQNDAESKEKEKKPVVPQQVFSNDGSFLERFKLLKGIEDEKKKAQESLKKRKEWEDSLKRRGKRKKPRLTEDVEKAPGGEDAAASAYLKEMKQYTSRLLKDDSGPRPLVK